MKNLQTSEATFDLSSPILVATYAVVNSVNAAISITIGKDTGLLDGSESITLTVTVYVDDVGYDVPLVTDLDQGVTSQKLVLTDIVAFLGQTISVQIHSTNSADTAVVVHSQFIDFNSLQTPIVTRR